MKCLLGIDVGSVSTNIVVLDEDLQVADSLYLRTQGNPINAITKGLKLIEEKLPNNVEIIGVGTTGSGRILAGVITGADIIKNEITAHAVAASMEVPDAQTVIEVGGQDSKIIILRDGIVVDFAMNTVCAAGTGSFLDQQASRLGIPIENFGAMALNATVPVRIAGRCTVFAESDMIHKQQMGHKKEDIIKGLCDALVRNYLNNVGKGKEIYPTIVFQGGVAANKGIHKAFEDQLKKEVIIPTHFDVMGAIGAGLLAFHHIKSHNRGSKFKGFQVSDLKYETSSFECTGCSNLCEVINITNNNDVIARWGSRCGKWETLVT
ncbi:MAG: 2-hydroxyglutaryl-CoA dehydratase [Desulfitibacter sp. BRH_c19]|nr:MAG: 2-hydroxyglutaryl-CoA dehydratase [Desulfitibacter sp. BRH_c19]